MGRGSSRDLPDPALQEFVDGSPDAVIGFDGSGRIVFLNQRAGDQFGYRVGELLGSPIGQLFSDIELLQRPDNAPGFRVELDGRLREGETFPAEVSVTPIRSDPPVRIALVRDLSDRARAEQDRAELLASERSARSQAEHASHTLDEFLATLSHELRNQLNAMLGWTQILRKHGAEDPQLGARAVETIERNVRIQTDLIDELLDMSRIVSGQVRLDPRPISLASVIEAALDMVAPGAANKGVRLSCDLEPQVGIVMGDPDRLHQVVWTLLLNAIKFTPRDGEVGVRLRQVGSYAQIDITDTSPGIDPAFLACSVVSGMLTHRPREGSKLSLGLPMVRRLVEIHGGTIQVDSHGPEGGSLFAVMIPVTGSGSGLAPKAVSDPRQAAPSVRKPSLDLLESVRGLRVLVVDDEPDTRDFLQRVLEDLDVEVFVAASMSGALDAIAEHHPDVLLCDVGMPGGDGYELIRRVRALDREHGGQTPAAALTACTRERDQQKALDMGFQLHVSKPVDPLHVAEILAGLVRKASRE